VVLVVLEVVALEELVHLQMELLVLLTPVVAVAEHLMEHLVLVAAA
jgi:hypothetical protein